MLPRNQRARRQLIAALWSVGWFGTAPLLWAAPTTPVVTDDGVYTTSTNSLHAVWTSSDPQSPIVEYQYEITRDAPTGVIVTGWTSTGTVPGVTATNFVMGWGKGVVYGLVNGITYYFGVKAKNSAGLWSAIGYSDGITVDFTPPSAPLVIDDGAATPSTTQLHASWISYDYESGIAEYQYAIGRSAGGSDVVPWTSVGTATQVTRTGLALTTGAIYYLSVKARNGAGLWSAIGTSNGIVAGQTDVTPPTGTVTIQYGSPFTNTPTVWLQLSATDGPMGRVVQMRFCNDALASCAWSAPEPYATYKSSWTLSSGDGLKTVNAQFQDAAGNWSAPASATITLDTTPPTVQITNPPDGSVITGP